MFEFDFTQIDRTLSLDEQIDLTSLLALCFALAVRAGELHCMKGNTKLFKDYPQVLHDKILELKAHDSVPLVELF